MDINEIIAAAEQAVKSRASEVAYKLSDEFSDPELQKKMYTLYREAIIYGARLMQEEIMKLIPEKKNDTQEETY